MDSIHQLHSLSDPAFKLANDFEVVDRIVRLRRTCKVLGDLAQPIRFSDSTLAIGDQIVSHCVASAGLAPFHYDRGVDGIAEPWRVSLLNQKVCRQLAQSLGTWFDLKASNKLPSMLAACGSLVLVTWLPQFRTRVAESDSQEGHSANQIQVDDEHLAATAALVQNMLLLLTAAGVGTYWSSGGVLGSPELFSRLGLEKQPELQERLLAAIFVDYSSIQTSSTNSHPDDANLATLTRVAGKNHSLRTPSERWCRQIEQLPGELAE